MPTNVVTASKRRPVAIAIATAMLVICTAALAEAANVTVLWDANTDGVTVGYRLFVGTTAGGTQTSGVNGFQIAGVVNTSYVIDLIPGTNYFFRLRAYDIASTLGPVSSEISYSLPTITTVGNRGIRQDTNTGALAITVGDIGTAVGSLTLSGSSSNTALVPNGNIVFGGSGANRTATVTPVAGQSGTTTITLTVNDGTAGTPMSFTLQVVGFTDNAITQTVTPIKRLHVIELRTLVDQVRTTLASLGAFSWTDPTLTAQTTAVRGQHIRDLRTAVLQAYTSMSRTPPTFTDPTLTDTVTSVKRLHIEEIRAAAIALMTPIP